MTTAKDFGCITRSDVTHAAPLLHNFHARDCTNIDRLQTMQHHVPFFARVIKQMAEEKKI